MPTVTGNQDARDYAERIRELLPRRLQELWEAIGLSVYALWLKCGVSRDTARSIRTPTDGPLKEINEVAEWRMAASVIELTRPLPAGMAKLCFQKAFGDRLHHLLSILKQGAQVCAMKP